MNTSARSSRASFQLETLVANNPILARSVSPNKTSSLGSQTVFALLQTQDLNQPPIGGGHGRSGHHGTMQVTTSLQTEEAEGIDERQ